MQINSSDENDKLAFERQRTPPSIRSLLRTDFKPAVCKALLSSINATPCLFLGRFSRESRARSGRHAEKAAKIDCRPFRATSTVPGSLGVPGLVCTVTISANASAILMFASEALGRTMLATLYSCSDVGCVRIELPVSTLQALYAGTWPTAPL